MPPDWDDDSPELRANLTRLLESVEKDARLRVEPTCEAARRWRSDMMRGLAAEPGYVGAFRGEPGLEWVQVRVGENYGVASEEVSRALHDFERRLRSAVALCDDAIAPGAEPNDDQLGAIIELCAWAHAEWVRIHPFANGNGRTARLWANSLAMRYGLPPFVRGRNVMPGEWAPMVALFGELLADFLEESEPDI